MMIQKNRTERILGAAVDEAWDVLNHYAQQGLSVDVYLYCTESEGLEWGRLIVLSGYCGLSVEVAALPGAWELLGKAGDCGYTKEQVSIAIRALTRDLSFVGR